MLAARVELGTTRRADPLPIWTFTDHAGRVEAIEADRIEADGTGWSWWTVVLVVNEPRWVCVRRVSAIEVIGEPKRSGT